jgi:hypothetical protein
MNYLYGHGAGYGLNAKHGDLAAAFLIFRELSISTREVTQNLIRGHRPLGFRRIVSVLRGALDATLCKPEPSIFATAVDMESRP